jgi:hypothetical protein
MVASTSFPRFIPARAVPFDLLVSEAFPTIGARSTPPDRDPMKTKSGKK